MDFQEDLGARAPDPGERAATAPGSARPPVRGADELRPGARAAVVAIAGDGRMAIRLLEMGFVPGVVVELIKRAPFGDPLELRVRGYHVSLRKGEARCVRVGADR